MLKTYVQFQKPQADMLAALSLPLLGAIYNFGWRAALVVAFSMAVCWAVEYAFTRREGKPASTAALVSGALLGLIVPPNVPFWQMAVGAAFCIVFAKMAFGGFGRNIFNPAIAGRCFLYICFPATMAATWYAPFTGAPAGFVRYSPDLVEGRVKSVEDSLFAIDGVTSATTLTGTKRLNQVGRLALAQGKQEEFDRTVAAYRAVDLRRLFWGNVNGSAGEGAKWLILLALIFLLWRGVVAVPLVVGPALGLLASKLVLHATGHEVMPLDQSLAITYLAGGTLFACTFMTTEPISAPANTTAKWLYGLLIGFLAGVIRSLSVFNAGFMFAIMLGNTFGPAIEMACDQLVARPTAPGAATGSTPTGTAAGSPPGSAPGAAAAPAPSTPPSPGTPA
ncbi:MAG: Na(+)-translocating NADH-quinone reductase subunit B [Candidatus Ozemobacter sibiricus]|uniref:Na(+)-translocating NADH-quinone reductase subunit B n=1 Tax=Candidatus Ozemobacter sibiricus TaxID=2268124 RepID=A0A367ZQC0_9BACT|nr:MAG: Na(+)-translocating NADH-quinone reductase subunit B [Candidatus Ozemobacter sibiricus]